MKINQKNNKGIEIFSVKGSIDFNTSEEFETLMTASLEKGQKKVILNLEHLDYITSEGIRIIMQTDKDLKHMGGKIVLCALQDFVKKVFEITCMDEYLTIENNLETAINNYNSASL